MPNVYRVPIKGLYLTPKELRKLNRKLDKIFNDFIDKKGALK